MSSIVVVGAGVAGLACAWRLSRAGHDVELLERDSQPGGRLRGEQHGAYRLDCGAQFFTSGDRNLHAILTAMGVADAIRPLAPAGFANLRDGAFEVFDLRAPGALLRSPGLSRASLLPMLRLGIELFRRREWLEPLYPERAACLELEGEPGLVDLSGSLVEELVEPLLKIACDVDRADLTGAFPLLALQAVRRGFDIQTLEGGLARIGETLARGLSIRLNCAVQSVETQSDGARVRYETRGRGSGGEGGRERSVLADAVVVAVPGSLVTEICPKLTPAERGFFEAVHYTRGIVCHLMLDRPPPATPHYAAAFPSDQGFGLGRLGFDHLKAGAAPAGAGLLHVQLAADAAAELWEAADAVISERVVASLARTPIGALSPRQTVVRRFAACRPRFGAGSLGRLAAWKGREDRSPRLVFAGDYLVGPHLEGAFTSGLRAASEIIRSLRPTA